MQTIFPRFPAFLALLALTTWSGSLAYYPFQKKLPNGDNVNHPCKPNHRWGGVGHMNPLGAGSLNEFGIDFRRYGNKWTRELCLRDSDSDGRTNGEELGDPSCVWEEGRLPSTSSGITNPGICDPIDSPRCLGKSDDVDCRLGEFETCERFKTAETFNFTVRFPPTTIPAKETNYFCMHFDFPTDGDYHLVAMQPILDNLEMIHHMLLFGCVDGFKKTYDTPTPCGMASSTDGKCSNILLGWTVGVSGHCWPEGVGYRFGANSYKGAMLQVHWNNAFLKAGDVDSSGLQLYYQNVRPEVQDLAMFILGQQVLNIEPGQESVVAEGECSSACSGFLLSEPINVTSIINHMHYLGRKQKIIVMRNGKEVATLANDEKYSYDAPFEHYFDPPFQIFPGDYLVSRCEFSSLSSQNYVYYGEGTSDEMCYSFLTVYPTTAFRATHACVQFGPISTCDFYTRSLVQGCDWLTFIDLGTPTMRPIYEALERNCNLDGFCRPECYQIYKSLKEHPCVSGDIFTFIVQRLSRYHEGAIFLGRLLSCKHYQPPVVTPAPDSEPRACSQDLCTCT